MGRAESLTPQQHLDKADAALARAKVAYEEYVAAGRKKLDLSTNKLAEYMDLVQIVNTHANMATAKSLAQMAKASMVRQVEQTGFDPVGPEF